MKGEISNFSPNSFPLGFLPIEYFGMTLHEVSLENIKDIEATRMSSENKRSPIVVQSKEVLQKAARTYNWSPLFERPPDLLPFLKDTLNYFLSFFERFNFISEGRRIRSI